MITRYRAYNSGPNNMKKTVRIPAIVLFGLFALQAANVVVRTIQVVYQDLPVWEYSDSQSNPCPKALGIAGGNLNRIIWADKRSSSELVDSYLELTTADRDEDGDGLTASEELWQLTSDNHTDSDEDGVDDNLDTCPNGFTRTYRDRIESQVVTDFLKRQKRAGPTYCVTRLGSHWDIDVPNSKSVVVDDWAFFYIRYETDLIPAVPCSEGGYVRLETRVFVPGGLYVYHVYHWFGRRCALGKLVFMIDVPVIGPVQIGSKVVEVS